MVFAAGNQERLRIASDGKVGIGTDLTTTPSSTLTVSPHTTGGRNISIYTNGTVGHKAGLFFNATSGTGNLAEIQAEYKGTNSGDLIFNTSMGERLRIASDGKVGINTTVVPYGNFAVDHGQYGLTRISDYSHILVQNKNASTTEFWNFAPRDDGSVSIGRGVPSGTGIITDKKLSITSTGEVNIGGNYDQTTYKMRVTGTVAATHFDSLSDLKLKTNVKQIQNPIETVKKIDGVTFNWKEDNDPSMGVIAQNVEEILPEIVSGDDVKSVNYSGLIGLLIETVKDQQKQIDELRGLIDK